MAKGALFRSIPVNLRVPDSITALYPFDGQFVDLGGQRMHYVDQGAGQPIVMLHGNPTWSFYYRELIKALSGEGYRAIAPDHIGCGLSEKPQSYSYTLETHIDNLERLIDHLQIENLSLMVHDWGAAIGFGYAQRHPDRVQRFMVFNSAAFLGAAPKRIRFCRVPLVGAVTVRTFNGFLRGALRYASTQPGSWDANVRAGYLFPYRDYRSRVAIHRFVQDIPLGKSHPSFPLLERIDASLARHAHKPILICWGMQDFCFTPDFLAGWLERFPQAEVHRLEDAGHLVLEDAGPQITTLVRNFLLNNPLPDECG